MPAKRRNLKRLALIGLLGAGLLAGQQRAWRPNPGWQAPPRAAARANPLAGRRDVLAGGRRLYVRECLACHGGDGSGLGRAANLRAAAVQQQSDGALFWKLSGGNLRRGMPGFSSLPELARWQLVLYLRTLGAPPAGAGRKPGAAG